MMTIVEGGIMKRHIKNIPVIPLRGITVFPEMIMHVDAAREKSLSAVKAALSSNKKILAVTQIDSKTDNPNREELYTVGTICEIKQTIKNADGTVKIIIKGDEKACILNMQYDEYISADVEILEEEYSELTIQEEAMIRTVGEMFERYAELNPKITEELAVGILGIDDGIQMMDIIIGHMGVDVTDKQAILECSDIAKRTHKILKVLQSEIEILQIQKEIYSKVRSRIDKAQKEYFLREQIKAIEEELGDRESINEEIKAYNERAKITPDVVKDKISKEIKKIRAASSSSPEIGNIKTYIETLLDIKWDKYNEEIISIKKANKILEKEHYGLTKVKERVLEYLAVRSLSKITPPPILCLIGPPGVGKTSIAHSIAHATGRECVRISLGGVKDEAEIRGHRRTYVGSIPGRIISGIIEAKSMNPVMILDEIDKMSNDFKGDPAAALLEVLDSKQNSSFKDHYLEVPVNLSDVLFIATANSVNSIPRPLLDRMEVIEMSSYTSKEKLEIAFKYLLPNQLERHNLNKKQFKCSKENMLDIIEHYTKEAGVRNIDRIIAKLCRKVAREIVESGIEKVVLNSDKVIEYLGGYKVNFESRNPQPEIGIVRGLAWTSVGGDTLSIEVNMVPGKGQLELTGQMGNVMKESARAAVSYIRARAQELAVDPDFYKNKDLHIHIPEGAVPKDGPSAGITMATAMISALTGKEVPSNLAMTGEITIRGRVLPIGGLREKLLAAKRANITNVVVPVKNKKDIEELEEYIVEGLKIDFASTMDDVLKYVFT